MKETDGLVAALPAGSVIVVITFWPDIDTGYGALAGTMSLQTCIRSLVHAAPHLLAAGIVFAWLFASARTRTIRIRAWWMFTSSVIALLILARRAALQSVALADVARHQNLSLQESALATLDPALLAGGAAVLLAAFFSLRVGLLGHRAFQRDRPGRSSGRRAIHGEANWMAIDEAGSLFAAKTGIVIGERYRVDDDEQAGKRFDAKDRKSWGRGGRAPVLCFDGSFGSSHGIAFAGSGGFKTTSVTIPTALIWQNALVVLDPSGEVAALVAEPRQRSGRRVRVLDPRRPETGFNALDWIGRHGGTREEDIAAVASWIMSESGRTSGVRDDFFRASGLQLLTAMIADVCLSGQTPPEHQTLRQVRTNLSEPEPQLRKRLQEIHDNSDSAFVRENVAAFVNMTPETFSGVYANAIKETHWLSYPNYAALVSGSAFTTEDVTGGGTDVFINIELKTLETHAGLARVIIGSLLNAIYNRNGDAGGRALFLLDEVARLGYMRILETARDAGRKHGITLVLLYQSIGQMRETYGGRDASSKWFESASWISFAAINDPETAEYISRRCGMTTVEINQVSRSHQVRGSSRTQSKQLAARPLILPHEVLLMRADEQIIFTVGNPPLRCGRCIWFRRKDLSARIKDHW